MAGKREKKKGRVFEGKEGGKGRRGCKKIQEAGREEEEGRMEEKENTGGKKEIEVGKGR